ncbi:hypothetical protein D5018_03705 [Parashewanella curva]|uniref:Uncharacterized protein n=1 Tax=Parashewanella curva TaxID=2338552 RepID=A0A3L8PZW8_9GAMM|nr:hypothetical protein [Parashewanella curva]RLV60957.1 hypothetical protein D5018_03705 [Parashewanella curva]
MSFFKGKKKHWIIVLHKYHVGSKDFKDELLMDATENEAKGYALIKAQEWQGTGVHTVSGFAVELPDVVQVVHQPQLNSPST